MTEQSYTVRRAELARELSARGYPISRSTLETIATRGGGPGYRKFGRVVLYSLAEALAWAEERASRVVRSATELRRRKAG